MADKDWKTLPPPVKAALSTAASEIRVCEAVGKYCGPEAADDASPAAARRRFIAVFKSRFVAYAGFESSESLDSAGMFVVNNLLSRLKTEGADFTEYLDWFFDDFMGEEYNKKRYAPPSIRIACAGFVLDKFLFANRDRLRLRAREMADYARRNEIIALGTEHLKAIAAADRRQAFGLKLKAFAEGKTSLRKFAEVFEAELKAANSPLQPRFAQLMLAAAANAPTD